MTRWRDYQVTITRKTTWRYKISAPSAEKAREFARLAKAQGCVFDISDEKEAVNAKPEKPINSDFRRKP